MSAEGQKEWFKEMHEPEERKIGWHIQPDPHIARLILQVKKEYHTKGKALDLGCGDGRHTIFCAKEGFDSYGIDYVENAIHKAKETAQKEKLTNAHFQVRDILNLDFPSNFFDLVIDSSVVDHVHFAEWPKYMQNLLQVLKVGGFLILSQLSAQDPKMLEKKHLHEHTEKPYPESLYYESEKHYDHYFHESEIIKMFSENFEIIFMRNEITPVLLPHLERLMLKVLLRRIK